jgi:type III restriction enzyme
LALRIKFVSNLDYELNAVSSVVDLFDGAVGALKNQPLFGIIPNPEIISRDTLNRNLKRVQERNDISVSKVARLSGPDIYDRPNFSIEMETGTGKTYVFLRTIIELNKRYGIKKFIIVVPSVAIREGILANLNLTKEHFQELYDRIPYTYRVFSSERITDIGAFCRSSGLEILILTIQSFNKKDINTLYQQGRDDVLVAKSGMEMLAKTNPVLILDEPHKMGSELSASSINNLNPQFVLRYSATHRDLEKTRLVYSLGPVEAHDLRLVKGIDVIGTVIAQEGSLPLIKFIGVQAKPKLKARVVTKVRTAKGVVEKAALLSKGDSLRERTGNAAYGDTIVVNISGIEGQEYLELSGGQRIKLNASLGDTYVKVAREQIAETIRVHFEKQEKLRRKGVKVLSLFFLDEVSDYQEIDSSIEAGVDELAKMDREKYLFVRKAFDEEFEKLKQEFAYWRSRKAEDVRGAYFSPRKTFKTISQDKDKIDEILRDKEKLLSFESPTSFIFTHSALNEGWDNPNVFNICTLRITHSEITKRQIIGRGLRIPVKQDGTRLESDKENILTVVANESFEEFAKTLQGDYREDGILKVPRIENRREKVISKLRPKLFNGEFQEIWDRLRIRTDFEAEIQTRKLIEDCRNALAETLFVRKPIMDVRRAQLEFDEEGIMTIEKEGEPIKQVDIQYSIPDILTRISEETDLTRHTIAKILFASGKLGEVFNNPEEFVTRASAIIKDQKTKMEIRNAKYHTTDQRYADDMFEQEVSSYRTQVIQASNSVYDKVLCDNESEKAFASKLGNDQQIKVFCKMPERYYIGTPIGNYRPDWGIMYQRKRIARKPDKKFKLVRETKFGYSDLRSTKRSIPEYEQYKIDCATKHFGVVGEIHYSVVSSYDDFKRTLPD